MRVNILKLRLFFLKSDGYFRKNKIKVWRTFRNSNFIGHDKNMDGTLSKLRRK